MARYTVHLPGNGVDRLGRARFIPDRFQTWGFAFGPFWLIAKGAWMSGLILLAVHGAFAMLVSALALPAIIGSLGYLVIQFAIGLEGSSLRRWELGVAGWEEAGLVVGTDLDDLERRFFAEQANMPAPVAPMTAPVMSGAAPAAPAVLGLFPTRSGS